MSRPSTPAVSPSAAPAAPLPTLGRLLLAGIALYRCTLAHVLGGHCRFHPSCSVYAAEAIRLHGSRRGVGLALRRLARCHPWGGGGEDPVPESAVPGPLSSGEEDARRVGRPSGAAHSSDSSDC